MLSKPWLDAADFADHTLITYPVPDEMLDLVQLTRLGAFRIVLGKWSALAAQSLLLVTATVLYLPKVLGVIIAIRDPVLRRGCGGVFGLLKSFLAETGATHLQLYTDPPGKLFGTLKAVGMPTTLLVDREGREIGRLVGPADWDSPEALALIAENQNVRVMLLMGEGKTFSAGGDFSYIRQLRGDPALRERSFDEGMAIFDGLAAMRVPVVIAVHGHAIGLGATLGIAVQLLVLIPFLRAAGFRYECVGR